MMTAGSTGSSAPGATVWLFPAYLFAINVFVLPIAIAGLLYFPAGTVDSDTFVLALPMAERAGWLALLAFVGGLSAATGMVIVETIALSTMVCNDLVMPVLLRIRRLRLTERGNLSALLLDIRRWAIVLILICGYFYFRLAGEAYAQAWGLHWWLYTRYRAEYRKLLQHYSSLEPLTTVSAEERLKTFEEIVGHSPDELQQEFQKDVGKLLKRK